MVQTHIVSHLGKSGLKKICAGLGTKFKASPTDAVVAAVAGMFDKHGTGSLSTGELVKAVQLLGAQINLGAELNVRCARGWCLPCLLLGSCASYLACVCGGC